MEIENAEATGGADEEMQNEEGRMKNEEKPEIKAAESAEQPGEARGDVADESAGESQVEQKPEDEGKIAKDEIPGLTESAQGKINERIHEINIRRKNAEAALAEREKEFNEAKERLKSLEMLSDEQLANVAKRTGLLPQYLEKEEGKIVEEYENLKGYRGWLRQHRSGYEGTGEKDPSMSAEEVADQELKVEDRLEEIGAKARGTIERGISVIREDLAEGRKLRLARKVKSAEKKFTPPPVLPKGKTSAGGPLIGSAGKARATFNQEEFVKDGASGSALEKQYQKIL